jgi:hypothetical protein
MDGRGKARIYGLVVQYKPIKISVHEVKFIWKIFRKMFGLMIRVIWGGVYHTQASKAYIIEIHYHLLK